LQIPDAGIWLDSSQILQGLATADDTQQDDHNCDHQQYMYEAADGVGTDQTDEPQDNEYDCNGIEHGNVLSGFKLMMECSPRQFQPVFFLFQSLALKSLKRDACRQ
jgi:hypothetical protein